MPFTPPRPASGVFPILPLKQLSGKTIHYLYLHISIHLKLFTVLSRFPSVSCDSLGWHILGERVIWWMVLTSELDIGESDSSDKLSDFFLPFSVTVCPFIALSNSAIMADNLHTVLSCPYKTRAYQFWPMVFFDFVVGSFVKADSTVSLQILWPLPSGA